MAQNFESKKSSSASRFPGFLPELRRMVIDEMHPRDRGTIEQCSFQVKKEARESKNAMHSLNIEVRGVNHVLLRVEPGDYDKYGATGYTLEFKKEGPNKIMRYSTYRVAEVWKEVLNPRTDLVRYASEHFQKLAQSYQRGLKNLEIRGACSESFDLDIARFRKLDLLRVTSASYKQKYPTRRIHEFHPRLSITYEQFQRLPASNVDIPIGQLTEENLCNFIRSWQNGEVRENLYYCRWDLRNSEFDARKFFGLFKEFKHDSDWLDLESYQKNGMIAKVFCGGQSLEVRFETK